MKMPKQILLKLTGEIIAQSSACLQADMVRTLAAQIKELLPVIQFSIVVGGGNFFRGAQQGAQVKIDPQVGHYAGMLATMMNGLIIKDILESFDIPCTLFCALECPNIGQAISSDSIKQAQQAGQCIIFTGGTANPFFTTDTNAVLRALQIKAEELWKGTKVDGIYTADPQVDHTAKRLDYVSYQEALAHKLEVMDLPAFALAQEYNTPIRVFNIFEDRALIKAAYDTNFGTRVGR